MASSSLRSPLIPVQFEWETEKGPCVFAYTTGWRYHSYYCSCTAWWWQWSGGYRYMQPQFVKTPPTSTGQFICDDWCLNYKMYKMFSHTVAVAESNGKLKEFISWYKKKNKIHRHSVSKHVMNQTYLLTTTDWLCLTSYPSTCWSVMALSCFARFWCGLALPFFFPAPFPRPCLERASKFIDSTYYPAPVNEPVPSHPLIFHLHLIYLPDQAMVSASGNDGSMPHPSF